MARRPWPSFQVWENNLQIPARRLSETTFLTPATYHCFGCSFDHDQDGDRIVRFHALRAKQNRYRSTPDVCIILHPDTQEHPMLAEIPDFARTIMSVIRE